jgi:hypothetical protein
MRPLIRTLTAAAVAAGGVCFALPSVAAQKILGSFNDWTAFVDGEDAKKICYVGSIPKKAEGKYKQRGDTYVLATHRPADNVFGEISVEAGYTYKDHSEVQVEIDGKPYKLFTKGGNAWAYDDAADQAMIHAMKTGREMVVKGTSNRGTLTTDTYSLQGFTAAYSAIEKACSAR